MKQKKVSDSYTEFLKAEFRFHGFVLMVSIALMNALTVIAIVHFQ